MTPRRGRMYELKWMVLIGVTSAIILFLEGQRRVLDTLVRILYSLKAYALSQMSLF